MTDDRDRWSVFHLSQSNPLGPGEDDVPALLRRVADSIDALGDVEVHDITYSSLVTYSGHDHTMTVYYSRDDD